MTDSIHCKVAEITPLNETTFKIRLVPERFVPFKAGQYLQVVLSENDKRPFSIASTADEQAYIELHIGASAYNAYAISVVEHFVSSREAWIEIPKGNAYLREESDRPLLLVAGGTGYAYVRSILTRALKLDANRDIVVFWGARAPDQIYDLAFLHQISEQYPNVRIVTTVEEATAHWQGKTGLLLEVVLAEMQDMSPYDIYLCGRFEMAKLAYQRFSQEANADTSRIFGDAIV